MIEIILSGFIGAILGSIIVVGYEEYKFRRTNRLSIAKEKLEKLYSPLYFFLENSKNISKTNENQFLHIKEQGAFIDEIITKYYYLADDDLRQDIHLLHSTIRYRSGKKDTLEDIFSKIRLGYEKYSKIIGLRG